MNEHINTRDRRIFEALNGIDEKYIAEITERYEVFDPLASYAPTRRAKRRMYTRLAAFAACLVLIALCLPALSRVLVQYGIIGPGTELPSTTDSIETPPPPETEEIPDETDPIETEGDDSTHDETDRYIPPEEPSHFSSYESIVDILEKISGICSSSANIAADRRAYEATLKFADEGEREWFNALFDSAITARYEKDLPYGYSIGDINGDGVNELLYLREDYMLLAVFSDNGSPMLIETFTDRYRGYIDTDGKIFTFSADNDRPDVAIYEISAGCDGLQTISALALTGSHFTDLGAYKLTGDKREEITGEEYWNLIKEAPFKEEYELHTENNAGVEFVEFEKIEPPDINPSNKTDDFEYMVTDDGSITILKYIGDSEFVEIPPKINSITVTKIAASAFRDNKIIKRVRMYDTIISIGESAFAGSSLEEITLSAVLREIGGWAFGKCEKLKEITLPDSLEKIGMYAFENCGLLEYISIPLKIKEVPERAFYGCNLKNIEFFEGLDEIGQYAFSGNSELAEVRLPDSVKNIGHRAFSDCGFTVFEFGKSLKTADVSIFKNCNKLAEVIFHRNSRSLMELEFKYYVGDDVLLTEKDELISAPVTSGPISVSIAENLPLHINVMNSHVCMVSGSDSVVYIIFETSERLQYVRLYKLDSGTYEYEMKETVWHAEELLPEKKLVAGVTFYGSMTAYGISFTDAAGNERHFAVYQSGDDGSPVIREYTPIGNDPFRQWVY